MAKQKGINARAWFYSTSFHSNLSVEPSEEMKQTVADLKDELARLEEGEGARMSLEGALIDAEQYRADNQPEEHWREGQPWTPKTARMQRGGTVGS